MHQCQKEKMETKTELACRYAIIPNGHEKDVLLYFAWLSRLEGLLLNWRFMKKGYFLFVFHGTKSFVAFLSFSVSGLKWSLPSFPPSERIKIIWRKGVSQDG